MGNQLKALQQRLGYSFTNEQLLIDSLSHRSYEARSNERLEFLGDSILGFIIADYIFHRFGEMSEGDMSRMRSNLVNGVTLSRVALSLKLDGCLLLGAGEAKSGGYTRPSILADALEALIAAIYIDSNIEKVRLCVSKWFDALFSNLTIQSISKDAKSELQEWLQSRRFPLPEYRVIEVSGPAHAQVFLVQCCVSGMDYICQGQDTSRKRAEQLAAGDFLKRLTDEQG